MIKLEFLGKEYEIINEWSELKGEDYLSIQKISDEAPKKFKEMLKAHYFQDQDRLNEIKLSVRESEKTFPKFYGDFICAISNISKDEMKKILKETREHIFWNYAYKFAMGCLIAPVDIEKFELDEFQFVSDNYPEHNGTYLLPKSTRTVNDKIKLGRISTIQFTESADLKSSMISLDEGDYHKIFNIVSILCLKEGEEYDEQVSLERAEAFKELTMDIVWDVFFYLASLNSMSKSIMELYSKAQEADMRKKQLLKQQD